MIDVSLLYLATEFSEVESRVFIITTKIADNFPNTGIDVEELQDARSTLQNIRDGRMAFSDDYLKDNVLRTYWEKLALVYPEILRGWRQGDLLPGGIRHQMDTMLHCARRIPGILYYLAVTNKLSPEIREHLLRKWESLDEIGEAHERFFGSEISLPRT